MKDHNYWVLCQLQSKDGLIAITSYGTTFKHDPPTLNDIISFQDKIVEESRYDQNYTACIVLNFKKISLEADHRKVGGNHGNA